MSWHWHLIFLFIWLSCRIFSGLYPHWLLSLLFLPLVPVVWLGIPLFYAIHSFLFSRRHEAPLFSSFRNALSAYFHYPYYYWVLRLSLHLTSFEKEDALKESFRVTRVSQPDSLMCPFCHIEIPHALQLLSNGSLSTTHRPLSCPRCGLRFDSCRYCQYYEPDTRGFSLFNTDQGKCSVIKETQSVDVFCTPETANRLHHMGWDTLYTGIRINDSFCPPDRCRQFIIDDKKMLLDNIPCTGKTRSLLLQLKKNLANK